MNLISFLSRPEITKKYLAPFLDWAMDPVVDQKKHPTDLLRMGCLKAS